MKLSSRQPRLIRTSAIKVGCTKEKICLVLVTMPTEVEEQLFRRFDLIYSDSKLRFQGVCISVFDDGDFLVFFRRLKQLFDGLNVIMTAIESRQTSVVYIRYQNRNV